MSYQPSQAFTDNLAQQQMDLQALPTNSITTGTVVASPPTTTSLGTNNNYQHNNSNDGVTPSYVNMMEKPNPTINNGSGVNNTLPFDPSRCPDGMTNEGDIDTYSYQEHATRLKVVGFFFVAGAITSIVFAIKDNTLGLLIISAVLLCLFFGVITPNVPITTFYFDLKKKTVRYEIRGFPCFYIGCCYEKSGEFNYEGKWFHVMCGTRQEKRRARHGHGSSSVEVCEVDLRLCSSAENTTGDVMDMKVFKQDNPICCSSECCCLCCNASLGTELSFNQWRWYCENRLGQRVKTETVYST